MSEVFTLSFLLGTMAVTALVGLARKSAKASGKQAASEKLSLIKQRTRFTDGQVFRHTLAHLGYRYEEEPVDAGPWGTGQHVELTVYDAQGHAWFALGRDEEEEAYSVISLDPRAPQKDRVLKYRLSDEDPSPALARIAQHYAFVKGLRVLLHDGYEIVEQGQQSTDGSRIVVLRKREPSSGELHQVRLLFQGAGKLSILTDSRRSDGTHGTCPDMEDLLADLGVAEPDKRPSPAARRTEPRTKVAEHPISRTQVQSDRRRHA